MLNHQITRGENIALVFLHGFCEDLSMWEDFTLAFEGHTILKVDLPGFGLSPTYDEMSIANMALEVARVNVHTKIEELIVVGHSMGGYVALEMSRLIGDRLKGVTMFHSHPFEDLPETKEKRSKAIAFVEEHGSGALMKTLIPTFFAPDLKEKNVDRIQHMIDRASLLSTRAVNNAMRAMRDKPSAQVVVEDLHCPYQVILGTEDIPTPYAFCLPQITMPHIAKLTILPGIGHMGMFTAKEKTQAALQGFIEFCVQKK
jgi:pimeloyl-ACP methyl ester carboxylesterase